MRNKVRQPIHQGKQAENKYILRARDSVFVPYISTDIRRMEKTCDPCNKHQPAQPKLQILQPDLPTRPWENLGTDIFEFNGENYLMVIDQYKLPCDKTRQKHDQAHRVQPLYKHPGRIRPTSHYGGRLRISKKNQNAKKAAARYFVVPQSTMKPTA